jgi:hypothetical protein
MLIVRWLTTRTENSDVECYCYVLNVLDENFNFSNSLIIHEENSKEINI